MTPIRCGYVDGRWGQVHYRMAPAPADCPSPPLLMLHPTPKSGWVYEPLMARLAAGRTTIAPDTPGYGASAAPDQPVAIEDYAAQMLQLCETLAGRGEIAPGPVDVIGYHTGSVIAVAMALLFPERVRRVVLVSLPAYDAAEREARTARLAHWPGPAADGSHLAAMWDLLGRLSDPRVTTEWKHASLTENLRCGSRASWGYRAVYGYDLPAALPRLDTPTLLLNPEDDLFDVTRRAAPLLPAAHSHYRELPGAAHGLFELSTDSIAALVEDFLDAG